MSRASTADVVICGAGIAGISAAYHLAVRHGLTDVVLVDERPPLSLTSDKSTECYRNWWPGPGDAMVSLMNRSIDIVEALAHESGNVFHLNRRGYLYVTADPARVPQFEQVAKESASLGAGPVRRHDGSPHGMAYAGAPIREFVGQPTGADLILDPALIRERFPYLSEQTVAVLHARRCGWLSAQQLGMWMLEQAREHGVKVVQARLTGVDVRGGRVQGALLQDESGSRSISTGSLVNAAGPLLKEVGGMLGVELPVSSELHAKVAFNDHLAIVPRDAPLLIWSDPQVLHWSGAERSALDESAATRHLVQELPSGAHLRPEGGADSPMVLMLWEYDAPTVDPIWPPSFDPLYPEVVLRGLSTMIPGLRAYVGRAPRPVVDGGYYTKTRENRPLIGPLPVAGTFLIGALSGFGIMAGCAAGELLAAHLTGSALPDYAPWFALQRYEAPWYQAILEDWGASGQL